MRTTTSRTVWIVLAVLLLPASSGGLDFDFQQQPGMPAEAVEGFVRAGQLWSDLLTDDITVRMTIGFEVLDMGVLGSTSSNRAAVNYADFVAALTAQPRSLDDDSAVGSLQNGTTFQLLINRTSNSPHGPGNAQVFNDNDGDANNQRIRMTRANAKALGLLPAHATDADATIRFNSDFNWDFEPDDGIDANHFNFVFVAAHEIGHALGFTSGVDVLDGFSPPHNGPFSDDQFTFVSPADVFRTSPQSLAEGAGTLDWAADNRPKNFSIDGGATGLGEFSRGRNFGDAQQASHWRDNQGLGLMDPTVAPGEISTVTELDRRFFDVVGYERTQDTNVTGATADLSLTVTTDLAVTFTVTVSNNGPDDVSGAAISSEVPSGLTNVQWVCSVTNGGSCQGAGSGRISDTVDLPVGSTATYVVTGLASDLATSSRVDPPAGVSDPDESNNSAEDAS